MMLSEVINELIRGRVEVNVEHGELLIEAPKGSLDDKFVGVLKKHKQGLITHIESFGHNQSTDLVIPKHDRSVTRIQLSFSQKRLWFLWKLEGKNNAYNIPIALDLVGELDNSAFISAIHRIVNRHNALRTVFREEGGDVYQAVFNSSIHVREESVSDLDQAQEIIDKELSYEFDLSKEQPIRFMLLHKSANHTVFLANIHHIVFDGWSVGVFLKELVLRYAEETGHVVEELPNLSIHFEDYSLWQNDQLKKGQLNTKVAYWMNKLAGLPPTLELPTDRQRPPTQSYSGKRLSIPFPNDLYRKVSMFCKGHDTTLFMFLVAILNIVFSKYSGREDLAIGTAISGRKHRELEPLLGFFVNTIVLRNQPRKSQSFSVFLSQVKQTVLEALNNQEVPFEYLVEKLQPDRTLQYSPIFQVAIVLQNMPLENIELPGLTVTLLQRDNKTSKYDLTCFFMEKHGELYWTIEYSTDIFDEWRMEAMGRHFKAVVCDVLNNPSRALQAIDLVDSVERHRLLEDWNAIQADYPHDKCVHELFEAQVEQRPNRVAVTFEDQQLTYEALNQKANQVAHYLRTQGVKPDALVGICVERSLEMVIGLLGILKAGGAYVPIDPSYPGERIRYMLEDSGVAIVLTQSFLQRQLPITQKVYICLDTDSNNQGVLNLLSSQPQDNPEKALLQLNAKHLAYVIYTSGSTGKPKGVLVEHYNVTRLLDATQPLYHFQENDTWTLFHSFAFDFSVWEIWGALAYGGKLIVVPKQLAQSPNRFYEMIVREKVTVLNQTPSAFEQFIELDKKESSELSLRTVIFGGESLNPSMLSSWFSRHHDGDIKLVNMYGITETTVHVTYYPIRSSFCNKNGSSIIGKKLPDLSLYVLDGQLSLLPVGVAGEMYVGGAGLTRGYLNNEVLTQEKFISNPFYDARDSKSSARLYKTGDLARWLPDGNIEFLGRVDDQVKIRGYRVELGEIESQLLQHLVIQSCVVTVREDSGDKRLVAYVVLREAAENDLASELRTCLQQTLPEYMIPSAYVVLDVLPLTPNGKVDKKALPAPDSEAFTQVSYVAPANAIEQILVDIWSELLKLPAEDISTHANFFALGGHSLLIVQMIARLQQRDLHTDVRQVFSADTLAALAQAITASTTAEVFTAPPNLIPEQCDMITPTMLPLVTLSEADIAAITEQVPGGAANIQDIYPLAPLQDGILFHHLLHPEHDPYVLPVVLTVDNRERLDAYLASLQAVIDRHDVLRTAVITQSVSRPVQVVYRQAELAIELIEVRFDIDAETQLRELVTTPQTMDISKAPLVQVKVAEDPQSSKWYVLQCMHHIAIDHIGVEIITAEVVALLSGHGDDLSPSVPYREFVAHTLRQAQTFDAKTYFSERLGDIAEPTLPFQLHNVYGDGSEVDTALRHFAPAIAADIRHQVQQLNVSPAALFHTAWALVVSACSGRDDVVFGTLLSGRLQGTVGADRMLGMFINTLPLRITLGEKTVRALVIETDAALKELITYEQASLALAQQCSGIVGDSPLFSALLNYRHNTVSTQLDGAVDALSGIRMINAQERTNYPFCLSVNDLGEGFSLDAQIDASISAERVLDFVECAVVGIVEALSSVPDKSISRLTVLPESERCQLLVGWNDTQADYPRDKCLHELFEARVEKHPNAIALVFEEQQLTYQQLNRRANQVAHYLQSQGVQADTLVGLCVERSLEMVIGLLGIIKAGGAYVPIDSNYPKERIRYILDDSGVDIILSQWFLVEQIPITHQKIIYLDINNDSKGAANTIPTQAVNNIPTNTIQLTPANLAYVIYTSGSTGQPKGVTVEHRGLCNVVSDNSQKFNVSASSCFLQSTPLNFDAAIWVIGMALEKGASLCVLKDLHSPSADIAGHVESAGVTHIMMTPSSLQLLEPKRFPSVNCVIVGGELCSQSLADRWSSRTDFFNAYGPTEASICVSTALLSQHMAVVVGKPNRNTQFFIVNSHLKLAPVGVVGEIYIGGVQLARGYLNNTVLTQEKFIPNPFSDDPEDRVYRTGDLARWLPNGNLEFIGRIDDQVKLRGYRIELGEIESQLLQHNLIQSCVVIVQEVDSGDKRLVAYTVLSEVERGENDNEDVASNCHTYLQQFLPEYMIPSAYVVLKELPLTPNGKVDKKDLPAPNSDAFVQVVYLAPANKTEKTLVEIWSDLLQLSVEDISIHANFFALGGHSLLIVQMIARLQQCGLHTDVSQVFSADTLADLARAITTSTVHNVFTAPPNLIPDQCDVITPPMLSLVTLSEADIAAITERVPGGAANIQDIYPLAPLQEGILFHHLLHPEHDPYVLTVLLAFDDRKRLDAYLTSLQTVIDRHDVLRTAVITQDLSRTVQVVCRDATLVIESVELCPDQTIEVQLQTLFVSPYSMDLSKAPLLQVKITKDPQSSTWYLLQYSHHIVSDHVALEIIVPEIVALLNGRGDDLPPSVPYREFVAHALHQTRTFDPSAFFRRSLGEVNEPTFPFGLRDVHGDGREIEDVSRGLGAELSGAIRRTARVLRLTPATLFHAAWALVVSRCSGQDEVVFGTVLSGRLQGTRGSNRMLGMFINTLPLKVSLDGNSAIALVEQVESSLNELLVYEQASLSLAQSCSGVEKGVPLFSAVLNYRHTPIGEAQGEKGDSKELKALGVKLLRSKELSNYPISVSVDDYGEGFSIDAQVVRSVTTAERMASYLEEAIKGLVAALDKHANNPAQQISTLPQAEQEEQLKHFNDTRASYPHVQCIHELFEEQVRQHPDNIAVVLEESKLSYKALNERANQVAHYLVEQGVIPDTLVGLCIERSLEMVVGLLGILKAGGGYVPIDPDHPPQRINYMLQDSGAEIVLTQQALLETISFGAEQLVCLDTEEKGSTQFAQYSTQNLSTAELGLKPNHLAYVIYTSGSTGEPKGVMIEHKNLVNHNYAICEEFSLSSKDVALQFASISFDLHFEEIFPIFLVAGKLVLRSKNIPAGEELISCLLKENVTVINLPTAYWQHNLEFFKKGVLEKSRLRLVVVGGEKVNADAYYLWQQEMGAGEDIRWANGYGPTEATISSSFYFANSTTEKLQNVPIGKPIANTQFVLLNQKKHLVPIGAKGEIYIGGAGVARGYHNNEALTSEKFIANPFSDDPNDRLYKTGDLARWLPDGNLEFIGRADDQVKIRGYRIELGEIESQLQRHWGIQSCVVGVREEANRDKRLVAYVVFTDAFAEEDHVSVLRVHLQKGLPEYMVPSAYIVLEELPLTANGKVDRKALPAPDSEAYERREYIAPVTETENILVEIWEKILEREKGTISTNASFFSLGGHSLLAVTLNEKIRKCFGVDLPLRSQLENQNIAELAKIIDSIEKSIVRDKALELQDPTKLRQLSFTQMHNLWFKVNHNGKNRLYDNLATTLRLSGKLNVDKLVASINKVVSRHSALRTRYITNDNVTMQHCVELEDSKLTVDVIDSDQKGMRKHIKSESKMIFRKDSGLLISMKLFRLTPDEHILLIVRPWGVFDGWSEKIFIDEMGELYKFYDKGGEYSLPELKMQYADFCHWQNNFLTEDIIGHQLSYWREKLSNVIPLMPIATDYIRPAIKGYSGAILPVNFPFQLIKQLRKLSQSYDSTMYTLLLSALMVLLHHHTKQGDIIISSPVSNRPDPEFEKLIGYFVNVVLLRVEVESNLYFKDVLDRVKGTTLEAFDNKDVPYEYLLNKLGLKDKNGWFSAGQITFNLQSMPTLSPGWGELSVSQAYPESVKAKFDLAFLLNDSGNHIDGGVVYDTDIFKMETVMKILDDYRDFLCAIALNPKSKIADLIKG